MRTPCSSQWKTSGCKMAGSFSHRSVLLAESIEGLSVKPNGVYIDGTAGGAGHSIEIASRLQNGRLIAIDQDAAAVAAAKERLAPFAGVADVVQENFSHLASVLDQLHITQIDGLLLDLGVSSYQLDTPERGFSYQADAPLDMRMDPRGGISAFDVVNTYPEEELRRIFYEYGEERFSPRIAAAIAAARTKAPIETTGQLADLIRSAIPAAAREGGHHPAKRTFQAIRICVNRELDVIEPTLRTAASRMRAGGRIAVITFHSLEDRVVKQTFADLSSGCTCPRTLPVCVCGKKPQVRVITKKPILPSAAEMEENPRARSAKLRIAEKC